MAMQHKGNLKSSDTTVETDEIVSSNNPWSPTLYDDIVYIRKPKSFRSTALPSNLRLSYQALYEAPGAKYVALLKRLTLSFAVLGCYGAKLFYESAQFEDIYAWATIIGCATPAAYIQFKTKDYVTRIFRLFDKEKPQTLENLVSDEQLVMEKLNMTGGKTYNQLLTISDNTSLTLSPTNTSQLLAPYSTWKEYDSNSNSTVHYYVIDDIGGMKMDRLWGIVEHNTGIDNGRYMETIKSS